MPEHYILDDDGNPVPMDDPLVWGHWYEHASRNRSRVVAQHTEEIGGVEVLVSTVFLGRDHSFGFCDRPVLWETMVFGGVLNQKQKRYTSRQEALAGHQAMCDRVKATVV